MQVKKGNGFFREFRSEFLAKVVVFFLRQEYVAVFPKLITSEILTGSF